VLFHYFICRCQAITNYVRCILHVALITVREYARGGKCLNLTRSCTSNSYKWLFSSSAINRTNMDVIESERFGSNWDNI